MKLDCWEYVNGSLSPCSQGLSCPEMIMQSSVENTNSLINIRAPGNFLQEGRPRRAPPLLSEQGGWPDWFDWSWVECLISSFLFGRESSRQSLIVFQKIFSRLFVIWDKEQRTSQVQTSLPRQTGYSTTRVSVRPSPEWPLVCVHFLLWIHLFTWNTGFFDLSLSPRLNCPGLLHLSQLFIQPIAYLFYLPSPLPQASFLFSSSNFPLGFKVLKLFEIQSKHCYFPA